MKQALQAASSFKLGLSTLDQKVLKRGYECIVHPDIYKQMGVVPEKAIADAKAVFERIWLK